MGMPQGRTYGPILGILLANLISKAVSAKYAPYFPFALSYDPSPWLAYNKPDHDHHHQQYHPEWYPIENPYESSQYPTLTTGIPHEYNEEPYVAEYDYSAAEDQSHTNPTTVEKPNVVDQQQAGSNVVNIRRRPTAKPYRRRVKPTRKRNKYSSQKRRRTTTPEPEYYDSYEEDYEKDKRRRPFYRDSYEEDKRRRPLYRDSYEDDDDYDYEPKPIKYQKQKRRPAKKKNKRKEQLTTVDYSYDDYPVEVPQTEIVIVRQQQRQQTTTTTEPTTLITNGTTTEMPTTTASTTTTANSTTMANSTSYGYGPSNGNEGISITYGPPQNRYQYSAPYVDWYTHDATRNAIVKRVHDIVEYDRELFQRSLK